MYNAGIDIAELIDELPAGIDRAILRILSFHAGRGDAISRGKLVGDLASMGFPVHEREVRLVINQLRKQGVGICSTGGVDGGYWLAADYAELEEFIRREIDARAIDLHEQASAMRRAAELKWGKYSAEKQARMW